MTPKNKRQKDINELMTKCGVFWAFSDAQFQENKTPLKEGDKYISIGGGGYMPKSNATALDVGINTITKAFNEAMKDEKARKAHIAYELSNHEAYYTGDITSTLDALGDYFSTSEVAGVYNENRKYND